MAEKKVGEFGFKASTSHNVVLVVKQNIPDFLVMHEAKEESWKLRFSNFHRFQLSAVFSNCIKARLGYLVT